MALAREFDAEDLVIEHSGVILVIDPDSAPLLEGAEIDYVDDLMKSGFTIHNPNAPSPVPAGSRLTPRRAAARRAPAAATRRAPGTRKPKRDGPGVKRRALAVRAGSSG
jgi:hypothetical protein